MIKKHTEKIPKNSPQKNIKKKKNLKKNRKTTQKSLPKNRKIKQKNLKKKIHTSKNEKKIVTQNHNIKKSRKQKFHSM